MASLYMIDLFQTVVFHSYVGVHRGKSDSNPVFHGKTHHVSQEQKLLLPAMACYDQYIPGPLNAAVTLLSREWPRAWRKTWRWKGKVWCKGTEYITIINLSTWIWISTSCNYRFVYLAMVIQPLFAHLCPWLASREEEMIFSMTTSELHGPILLSYVNCKWGYSNLFSNWFSILQFTIAILSFFLWQFPVEARPPAISRRALQKVTKGGSR